MSKKAAISRMSLDELDLQLVRELELNARQTTRNLGAKLGVSAATVSNRIQRMVKDRVITFHTISNPAALGFRFGTILGLRISPGKTSDVARNLKGFKNIRAFSLTTGRYDMLAHAFFRDNEDLLSWLSGDLSGIRDIVTAEAMIVLKWVKSSYVYVGNDARLPEKGVPWCPDESELKLIKALELNPRETVGNLGRKIGVSRQATAIKLKKLLDNDVMRVVSLINPDALGSVVRSHIFLRVRLDRIVPTAQIITDFTNRRIQHVIILGGYFNIMVYALFTDLEEMSCFLTDELGCIPGVIDHETMIHVGHAYRSHRLLSL